MKSKGRNTCESTVSVLLAQASSDNEGFCPVMPLARIDHGADGLLQDADGETALHKAAAEVRHVLCETDPLHWPWELLLIPKKRRDGMRGTPHPKSVKSVTLQNLTAM